MATKLGKPYERFRRGELILRDELAIDRTRLANERTLLAYIRTALAFAVTGAAIIKFLDGVGVSVLGSGVIAAAVVVAALGVVRYRQVSGRIRIGQSAAGEPPAP
jgi:putative membrane protein